MEKRICGAIALTLCMALLHAGPLRAEEAGEEEAPDEPEEKDD